VQGPTLWHHPDRPGAWPRVLDILEGRDGSALKAWLKEHPDVEILTRDRWAAFIQAANAGAPQAKQVGDRWHLLKNLREVVEQLLARSSSHVREALQEPPEPVPEVAVPAEGPTESVSAPPVAEPPSCAGAATPKEQARQAKRQERVERYRRVRKLHAEGMSVRRIARATGLSKGGVLRYLRAERCPDWKPHRPRRTQLDGFADYIDTWIERGERNAADLYRELVGQGLKASYDAVRRYLVRHLGSTGRPGPRTGPLATPVVPSPPSARQLSFEFVRKPEDRKTDEQSRMDKLHAGASVLREGLDLAGEFAKMVRKRSQVTLTEWLVKAEVSSCVELRNFATSLRTDEAAVTAALETTWSNGAVEGHVNRLKLIKRQMYGRAGFQLLRARVRYAR
jgi:transposase